MERKTPLLRLFVGTPARTRWSGWLVVSGSHRKCVFYASVILPLLHSWTSLPNILTLPCCVLGTFSTRSGLLAPVHSSAIDDTQGRFLWRFFLLIIGISMTPFYQMKQEASVRRTYKKEMVVARSTLVHLRHSARAQPRPVMLCYGRL
ncbi:cytochrome c biogenesis CcmF N-terminal-like mitochondrial protein 2 [Triticum aestivum]|uniref:cytochrome c biogenesis CcmF N-terminal-like mitochondrial protein 2 n=1 Tax=Triticum aestivum TaxID=4565 RepID=UPI001ABD1E8F|nr:cytochrome c biogenesis CcmF N-terminal-like mitochondrial protein 2 [Aegilops tauschii subsp. strangulata]XP_044444670.1 cytochrome c biogenesis CcmF N-terminal-like mitochondrial protein 2 [Triticum aestivum]